ADEFIDDLRFTGDETRKLGLRMDVTLGSGWPFGGPHIPITQAAGALRIVVTTVPRGAHSIAVPSIGAGEELIAAFLAPGEPKNFSVSEARQVFEIQNVWLRVGGKLSGPDVLRGFLCG